MRIRFRDIGNRPEFDLKRSDSICFQLFTLSHGVRSVNLARGILYNVFSHAEDLSCDLSAPWEFSRATVSGNFLAPTFG